MTEYFEKLWNIENTKRGYNVEIVHTSAKVLHLNFFWILFPYLLLQVCPVEARRKSSQCLHMREMPAKIQKYLNPLPTAVYLTIETVGGNPVRLRLRISIAVTGEGNLVWSRGGFVGNRTLFTGFASSDLTTDTSWVWSRLNPRFMRGTRAFLDISALNSSSRLLRLDVTF